MLILQGLALFRVEFINGLGLLRVVKDQGFSRVTGRSRIKVLEAPRSAYLAVKKQIVSDGEEEDEAWDVAHIW